MLEKLNRLFELVYIGGLIEWTYIAIIDYFISVRFLQVHSSGQLHESLLISVAGSYLFYIAVVFSLEVRDLDESTKVLVLTRYFNVSYHTMQLIIVYNVLEIGNFFILAYLPLLLLVPVAVLIAIVILLYRLSQGVEDDWKRYRYPVLYGQKEE
jgi:uncharacterized membrane protein